MAKSIVSVGFQLATDSVVDKNFISNSSLLDWDIVLFRPDISSYFDSYESSDYNGKQCLGDSASFRLKETCAHWRREIKEAVESGKTVVVFLSEIEELYVATGEKEYSGTGRSRQATRIVEPYFNYKAIPISEKIVSTHGTSMKVAQAYSGLLSGFWAEFESHSNYHLIFPDSKKACIQTKTGEKAVGLIIPTTKSNGNLVLLPDIDFKKSDFFTVSGDKFTKKAQEFASRLVSQVVSLDKALRSTSEVTPEPAWLGVPKFTTKAETNLRQKLLLAEAAVEAAQRKKEAVEEELQKSGSLKSLLFEGGKQLEASIIEALKLLGFSAAAFQNSESEFDVVFESSEGRLVGEAEGKESKAINIEKLRQLSMNIHEDLQRDHVSIPAKGILFGNGYRLAAPDSRATQFTDKCISAAQSTGIGLVETSDLYAVAKHLADTNDPAFAKSCRDILTCTSGLIKFPSPSIDLTIAEESVVPAEAFSGSTTLT